MCSPFISCRGERKDLMTLLQLFGKRLLYFKSRFLQHFLHEDENGLEKVERKKKGIISDYYRRVIHFAFLLQFMIIIALIEQLIPVFIAMTESLVTSPPLQSSRKSTFISLLPSLSPRFPPPSLGLPS